MVNDVKKPRKLKRAKMWESRLNFKLKASEYPFKQNKNALKNLTVLLYTSFYNISLNVLRPNFFNRYNLPFLPSHKINQKSKVGAKTNYFWYFRSSYTIRIMFFNKKHETNKTDEQPRDEQNCVRHFLLLKYFLNNLLLPVFMQNMLSKLVALLQ